MIQFFYVPQLGHLIKQGSKNYQTVLQKDNSIANRKSVF